jgi:transglutaminase-like putative cysteine protease
MLRPRDSHDLRLLGATLGLYPAASRIRWAHDVFSNSIANVDFNDIETDRLEVVSTLDLQHFPAAADLPLDPIAETYPFGYTAEEFPDIARDLERHYPDSQRKIDRWARKFLSNTGMTKTMDMLVAMTEAIKADFEYQAREAQGTNAPLVTLETKRGACRDFALLMMEAARSLGLAARFISGYLYDESLIDSTEALQGGGATHAWCAIYLPGAGWVEFDPTNGLVAGKNLIRVAVARTPSQAVPISGGFTGNIDAFLDMNVEVVVKVKQPGVAEDEEEPEVAEV